eukprot:269574_1
MSFNLTTTTDEPTSFYHDVYASLPELVTAIYLGIFLVAFLILAIYAHYKLNSKEYPINCSFPNWCKLIIDLHKIYVHAVIHTADTVSDAAVMAQFWRLAYRELHDPDFNVEGLDMMGLFLGTISALLMYRLYTAYHFFYIAGGSVTLFLVQFFDFGVYLSIYLAWKLNRTEPIFWQDYITHVEALFESIPQIFIQSQFVLRSGHSISVIRDGEELQDIQLDNSIVVASIVIAFACVVARFVKSDFPFVDPAAHTFILHDCPYISWKCIALYFWRMCEIVTRLVCGVFLWAVLGFWPFLCIGLAGLAISSRFLWKTRSHRFLFWHIAIPIECITQGKRKHIWYRCVENWIYLAIITLFSFDYDLFCYTCSSIASRTQQLDPGQITWTLGYFYLFLGWICSILLPICWAVIVPKLYTGKKPTPESRREEIMALPRMFYRKNGCYKATVTPLHFAVHRRFDVQIKDILQTGEVDINEIRISGATALHSAVGRSLKDMVQILLKYGANPSIIKKQVWYFAAFIPCKWCGARNWYEGKTAIEIAQFKIDKEKTETGKDLDEDHRYVQVLDLLLNPPDVIDSANEKGRHTEAAEEVELNTKETQDQIVGNSEDALMDDMVVMDVDAEPKDVEKEHQRTSLLS